MYAIIESGGKQYRIEKGDIIDIELLKNAKEGKISFDHVLFLNDGAQVKIGAPHLKDAKVNGEILSESKGPKVIAYKYKRRKGYQKKKGHRQKYLRVKITEIQG
jgi:large subunit ribosomal protein L21